MAQRTRMSKVYTMTSIGLILLSALIASPHIPSRVGSGEELVRELSVSALILGLVGWMTVLAVTAIGIASLINIIELAQDRLVEGTEDVLQRMEDWDAALAEHRP